MITLFRLPKPGVRAAVVFVLLLLCAACSSDPADADRVALTYSESPINDLLGIDIALRSGDLVALEREAEQLVVDCMLQDGFEYIAIDFDTQLPFGANDASPDTREFAERNGYGISVPSELDAPDPENVVDPNDEIRAQLSPSELDAYQQALFGEAPLDEQLAEPGEQSGCVAESYVALFDAQSELQGVEAFFGTFATELSELEDRFRADPRFQELEAQWSLCMNEQGFAVDERAQIFVELDRRMAEVGPGAEPGEEPSADVQQQMDEVRDWERDVAVADWDCTEPVQEEMATLRYGYEALFLEENQDRIGPG